MSVQMNVSCLLSVINQVKNIGPPLTSVCEELQVCSRKNETTLGVIILAYHDDTKGHSGVSFRNTE